MTKGIPLLPTFPQAGCLATTTHTPMLNLRLLWGSLCSPQAPAPEVDGRPGRVGVVAPAPLQSRLGQQHDLYQ